MEEEALYILATHRHTIESQSITSPGGNDTRNGIRARANQAHRRRDPVCCTSIHMEVHRINWHWIGFS